MKIQEVLEARNMHNVLHVTGERMGKHGLGVRNDNGDRLCGLCDMNEMVITGTLFPRMNIDKATWVFPDGASRNQIDHILLNRSEDIGSLSCPHENQTDN